MRPSQEFLNQVVFRKRFRIVPFPQHELGGRDNEYRPSRGYIKQMEIGIQLIRLLHGFEPE